MLKLRYFLSSPISLESGLNSDHGHSKKLRIAAIEVTTMESGKAATSEGAAGGDTNATSGQSGAQAG